MWNTSLSQQVLIEFNIQPRCELLNKFVLYTFSQYETLNLEDYNLWNAIQVDYEDWKEEHFNQLSESTWKFLRQHCYTHEFWLKETNATSMLQIINSKFYENWIMNQIRWVEERWNRLSKRMIKRKQRLIDSHSIVSVIESTIASVIQSPPSAISINQSSQQISSIIENAISISIKQAILFLIQQASEQASDQASPQASPQAFSQAPDQALSQAPDQAISKKAIPHINQNVILILNQNVIPILIIQNATSKQAIPLISQNLISIKQAISFIIQQAISKKAISFINQNVISILSQNVILTFSQNMTSNLIQNATLISQNAILIAGLFKKKVFQSISQHLIVCLVIIISTLSAREIG